MKTTIDGYTFDTLKAKKLLRIGMTTLYQMPDGSYFSCFTFDDFFRIKPLDSRIVANYHAVKSLMR